MTTTSGSDGNYVLRGVAPGTYSLTITMPGFGTFVRQGVKVAGATVTINAKLAMQDQQTIVNVTTNANTVSVDQDNNASATILTGKDLDALSDDPDELSSELSALAGPAAGPNGGQIYIDGFTGGQLPPKSSIREIRINQNPFSAQYDRAGFGRVEIFTKPGTDKFHGNANIQGQDKSFNSGSPFVTGNTLQPDYHTILGQGSLTGPINKNASFTLCWLAAPDRRQRDRQSAGHLRHQPELRHRVQSGPGRLRHLRYPGWQRLHLGAVYSANPLGYLAAHRPRARRKEHPHHPLPVRAQRRAEPGHRRQ